MELIAKLMQNEMAVVTVGITAMVLGFLGVAMLAAIAVVSTFIRPVPGGRLTFAGVLVLIAMYVFAWLMTSTMELQYGPQGGVIEASFYSLGGFLCVAGYARMSWWLFRSHRNER